MITLAFDLSMSCTGWAVSTGDHSQIHKFGEIEGPQGGTEGERFLKMGDYIGIVVSMFKPGKIIFAEFHNTPNMQSGHANIGLRAILLRLCAERRIPCTPVSEISCRKRLGVDLTRKLTPDEEADHKRRLDKWNKRGRQTSQPKPKRDMKARVKAVLDRMGHDITGEDARDAVVLLLGSKQ